MTSLDTNVIVRFLVRDDEAQYRRAEELLCVDDTFVCSTVLLETEWVLRATFGFPKADILSAFERLGQIPGLEFFNVDAVRNAIAWSRRGLEFEDALHVAMSAEVDAFATFDRAFARRSARLVIAPSVQLLK